MRIERQVISKEVHVVAEQQAQAGPPRTGDHAWLVLPEVAMVDQQGICTGGDCPFENGERCGDPGRELVGLGTSFDLQPIGAVVPESRNVEHASGIID